MARAEQFAFYEHNETEFAEFCPVVQRYGEMLNRTQTKQEKDREVCCSTRRWQQ